ncbi:NAD(+) diphosphatase [Arthrobacter sp.]|uniref:NAD(+) diphosphatase n=1 Tax=Arthrobacter sp. TaxID=1667 RepID=UPI0028126346|nr:NAD(+) diphosphatase [Arthrobacter sp.]
MSLAEPPAPQHGPVVQHQTPPQQGRPWETQEPVRASVPSTRANHLTDNVLPVRPALVDRGSSERLKPGMVQALIESGNALAMVLAGRKALVQANELVLLDADFLAQSLGEAGVRPEHVIYLGSPLDDDHIAPGTGIVLFVLADALAPGTSGIPKAAEWAGFRDVAAQLDALHTALFVEASAIANWHSTHTHCPRCGARTTVEAGGWVRRCPEDGSEHYPRTDPAIIVTVVGADGRLLLGGGGPVDAKNYSTLAGFVEPGESLEQAVVREIFEEVGVRVTACQYLGSQAWPFPASLMLGFTALTSDVEPRPDGVEVTRARWFNRAELQDAVLQGDVVISSSLSISRSLIEHWYGGVIQDRPAGS